MVGAGRFERPTPCAQGSFRPPKKMPYSQLLTFQADGATLLQLVAPCGTRRLSPATILSTVGFHQRLDLGLQLRAPRDCHLPAAGPRPAWSPNLPLLVLSCPLQTGRRLERPTSSPCHLTGSPLHGDIVSVGHDRYE